MKLKLHVKLLIITMFVLVIGNCLNYNIYANNDRDEKLIGKYKREIINDTLKSPYRSIVYINMIFDGKPFSGTGILIGRNKVLTCAHNLYDRETKQWAKFVSVTPAKNQGYEPYFKNKAKSYILFDKYYKNENIDSFDYDIAVINLEKNYPQEIVYDKISNTIDQNSKDIYIVGYPGDMKTKMVKSYGKINQVFNKVFYHNADTEHGNSGSPVFNKEGSIIGVHTSLVNGEESNRARIIDNDALRLINIAMHNKNGDYDISRIAAVYRLKNKVSGEPFFTYNIVERNRLVRNNGFEDQGIAWFSNTKGNPVYRLYHPSAGLHFYTKNVNEKNILVNSGWKEEGIAWFDDGSVNVYRLRNDNNGFHMYTTNTKEVEMLKNSGWILEGVGFNAVFTRR